MERDWARSKTAQAKSIPKKPPSVSLTLSLRMASVSINDSKILGSARPKPNRALITCQVRGMAKRISKSLMVRGLAKHVGWPSRALITGAAD